MTDKHHSYKVSQVTCASYDYKVYEELVLGSGTRKYSTLLLTLEPGVPDQVEDSLSLTLEPGSISEACIRSLQTIVPFLT